MYLRYYDTTYFDYITFNKKDNGISYNSAMVEIPLEFSMHDYKNIPNFKLWRWGYKRDYPIDR